MYDKCIYYLCPDYNTDLGIFKSTFYEISSLISFFACVCAYRENILVLDIFFEALNYEKIEQKKAYEVAGLLGETYYGWDKKIFFKQTRLTDLKSPCNTSAIVL